MDGIRNQLKGLEESFWGAVQNKDVDRAMSLSDDSCIVVGAQGVGTIDSRQDGRDAAAGDLRAEEVRDR